ncbi:uncharacterized protein (DUF2225 family) [Oikeobacillus pervagus]|uniref:Uncharacterized protein (DUF2225 family) n=1 Tax=Oikeobacillus pervagus TaxID=1325931 RepID=A0AAJ1WGK5_9BACI|nr:DUF2225 domain-containing protein [Oikeobacillus pervagus]MDQ0215177.1 uncharacterized protein (DUF2225 family) [Oikeobacillus pervagus]
MDEITPLYGKKEKCLFCHKSFITNKVRSRFIKVIGHDTDLCPIYENNDINPLFYNVKVCPHCGFSFTEDFSPYFSPNTKGQIEAHVCAQWVPQEKYEKERNIQVAINSYKLAAYCANLKKEKHITIAGLLLRTAWLYRELKNEKQETRFLKLAADHYYESYMADDFTGTQMTDVKVLYLIGELNKRIGKWEKASTYFSKVIEKQRYSTEKRIIEMAREQWYELRDTMKEVK